MLQAAACGFGGLAFSSMLARANPLAVRAPHYTPRAKRVIFLFMAGGPSQGDLFAPKELITKNHGQAIESPAETGFSSPCRP